MHKIETLNVETKLSDESYTPYKLAKLVNELLDEANIMKELPAQMFYTYAKKGMFGNEKNTKIITREQAVSWVVKYFTKNQYM